MNCRHLARDLTELKEGELPFGRKALLRFHLAICPACKQYAKQMEATSEALHHVQEPLPDDASRAIAERILRARK